jgi:hypothetical protein
MTTSDQITMPTEAELKAAIRNIVGGILDSSPTRYDDAKRLLTHLVIERARNHSRIEAAEKQIAGLRRDAVADKQQIVHLKATLETERAEAAAGMTPVRIARAIAHSPLKAYEQITAILFKADGLTARMYKRDRKERLDNIVQAVRHGFALSTREG